MTCIKPCISQHAPPARTIAVDQVTDVLKWILHPALSAYLPIHCPTAANLRLLWGLRCWSTGGFAGQQPTACSLPTQVSWAHASLEEPAVATISCIALPKPGVAPAGVVHVARDRDKQSKITRTVTLPSHGASPAAATPFHICITALLSSIASCHLFIPPGIVTADGIPWSTKNWQLSRH